MNFFTGVKYCCILHGRVFVMLRLDYRGTMFGLRNINKYFGISTLILVYFGVIYALSEEEGEGIVLLVKNLIYFRDHTGNR